MAETQEPMTPSQRFHALLDGISDERLAEIEMKVEDPDYVLPEVELRDDPDPFGMNWDWLPGDDEES